MCSWCWGFAPVLEQLDARYTIPITTIVGGLRPGSDAEPLNRSMRDMLLHHWDQVEVRTGQPFDRRGLDRDGWVYDTELPARAVVTMREMAAKDTLSFFTHLQHAFYADAVDVTALETYPDLVAGFAVDTATFLERLGAESSRDAAWADFRTARRMGVAGYPTLLLRIDDRYAMVTRGYAPFDALEPAVTAWLTEQYPDQVDGIVCSIDGAC
jgi:putative protein-disulfide isomerase